MLTLLKDIRVLEVSTVVMGPLAGQILADLGAEVLKVEPLEGDGARASYPQQAAGMGALYVNNNRNKKVIALDLRNPESRPIIERMIARSDVLLHNLRPESAERLGIGFDSAARINPRIVYCSAIGFGQGGRYRNRPAYDDIIQAVSGLAGIAAGEDPRFIPTILADKVCALHAVYGILAALVARDHGREGAIEVQVPMFEAMVSFVLNEHLAGATFAEDGKVGYPRILSEHRRPHRTRDGWIAVLPYTGEHWRRFLTEIGQPQVCNEAWFQDASTRQARIHELYSIASSALAARTTAEWMDILRRLDVPCSEVNRIEDLLDDPHLADVDFFSTDPAYPPEIVRSLPQPVVFQGAGKLPDHAAPPLGAHTREILHTLSLSDEEIDTLAENGVVREHSNG
ncbi:MAG TPA: CoA transferase [Terracidiphilus sp.]|jgi:crotonobetainyl-CoA:carnitine CoA-transferase CaiB-like acyl-CoA transferase